jgi:hypothetical protein
MALHQTVPAGWSCSIRLSWAIGWIARNGIWTDGGPARQKRWPIQETPAKHAPTLDLGQWLSSSSRGGKAGQKPRSDLVSCRCSAGFAIPLHEKTAHLLGPCLKEKGCDTCDTCDTCKRLPSREVHRYTISLPSFHLRLWIWCYHPRGLAPDLRTTQSISVPTHGPDDVCDP